MLDPNSLIAYRLAHSKEDPSRTGGGRGPSGCGLFIVAIAIAILVQIVIAAIH
jgi:hypothetical protein